MSYSHLEVSQRVNVNVTTQKYALCSMMTPNMFPVGRRKDVEEMEVYGFKLYGVFETEEDMDKYGQKFQKQHKLHNIFPFEVGKRTDFDTDTAEAKNTKFVYHEKELNDTVGEKTFNVAVDTNETKKDVFNSLTDEEIQNMEKCVVDENENVNMQAGKYRDGEFRRTVLEQNFCCVTFFPAEYYRNFPHMVKGRKIVSFYLHGVFETISEAQKYTLQNKDKLIFIIEVGKWSAFYHDILKNCNPPTPDDRNDVLNHTMELYEKALREEGEEEKTRKQESLQGANVVSGQYPMMGTYDTKSTQKEENATETEDDIDKELERLRLEKEQVEQSATKRVECSKEDFDKKCDEILAKHRELQN